MADHTKDSDCTVNEDTLCCDGCGVDHSDECLECGGRGFHKPNCDMVNGRMRIPHSSTPWSTTGTIIADAHGNSIIDVRGTNEQSAATAAHIVRVVNEWHENHADAENERHAADR